MAGRRFLAAFLSSLAFSAFAEVPAAQPDILFLQDPPSPQFKETIGDYLSKMLFVYRDVLGLELTPPPGMKIRLINDFPRFKEFQKEVSKTAESDTGFYSASRKEMIVWNNPDFRKTLRIIFHEASHSVLRGLARKAPKWVDEGLAELFEYGRSDGFSIELLPQRQKTDRVRAWLRAGRIIPLERYLALSSREWRALNREEGNPASTIGWSLTYFLMSDAAGRQAIQAMLSGSGTVDQAYPGGVEQLERDWRRWALAPEETPLRFTQR